jgi:hypothetical protein
MKRHSIIPIQALSSSRAFQTALRRAKGVLGGRKVRSKRTLTENTSAIGHLQADDQESTGHTELMLKPHGQLAQTIPKARILAKSSKIFQAKRDADDNAALCHGTKSTCEAIQSCRSSPDNALPGNPVPTTYSACSVTVNHLTTMQMSYLDASCNDPAAECMVHAIHRPRLNALSAQLPSNCTEGNNQPRTAVPPTTTGNDDALKLILLDNAIHIPHRRLSCSTPLSAVPCHAALSHSIPHWHIRAAAEPALPTPGAVLDLPQLRYPTAAPPAVVRLAASAPTHRIFADAEPEASVHPCSQLSWPALEHFCRELYAAPPHGVAWAALPRLASALQPCRPPPPTPQFVAEPSLAQWQQHVMGRPFPAQQQQLCQPLPPAHSSCGIWGREWAAGGAAVALQRVIDAAAVEGRLRPEEATAARGALAALLEGR